MNWIENCMNCCVKTFCDLMSVVLIYLPPSLAHSPDNTFLGLAVGEPITYDVKSKKKQIALLFCNRKEYLEVGIRWRERKIWMISASLQNVHYVVTTLLHDTVFYNAKCNWLHSWLYRGIKLFSLFEWNQLRVIQHRSKAFFWLVSSSMSSVEM